MRKTVTALLAAALLLGMLAGCSGSSASGEAVTVEQVSAIVNGGSVGLADRYAGVVAAGETAQVKRDQDKTILETYVEEGDLVKAGDLLFAYDTEAMQLDLDKAYLEKEKLENTIAAAQDSIAELEKERNKANDSDKLRYTLQIDSKNVEIREAQYNITLQERDIATKEAALENAEVYAPIAGRVMSVDETGGNSSYDVYGDQGGASSGVDYITITDVTRLRIQGVISEMNASALAEGMAMTIRSRLDKEQTWTGTLSLIDWENPVQNNNDGSMVMISTGSSSSDDGMTTASKYPFYIELDDTEGLMLGQHVYIEPDKGEGDEAPAGPMLPMYYIQYEEDGSAFVWAAGKNDKLEKRAVTLGVQDDMMGTCEIAEGLELTDYIAFPQEGMTEGQATEKYDPTAEMEDPEAVDAPRVVG